MSKTSSVADEVGMSMMNDATISTEIDDKFGEKIVRGKDEDQQHVHYDKEKEERHEDSKHQNTFPQVMMAMLNSKQEKLSSIVTWLPHGNAFLISNQEKFAAEVMPKYFKQTKFASFIRKLNRWGFKQIMKGPDAGAFHNKLFRRDSPELCKGMECQKASNIRRRRAKQVPSRPPMAQMPNISQQGNSQVMFRGNLQEMFSSSLPQHFSSASLHHHQRHRAILAASAAELRRQQLGGSVVIDPSPLSSLSSASGASWNVGPAQATMSTNHSRPLLTAVARQANSLSSLMDRSTAHLLLRSSQLRTSQTTALPMQGMTSATTCPVSSMTSDPLLSWHYQTVQQQQFEVARFRKNQTRASGLPRLQGSDDMPELPKHYCSRSA